VVIKGFLTDGPIGCLETSVRNYNSSLRSIPEERKAHVRRGGSLKYLHIRTIFLVKLT